MYEDYMIVFGGIYEITKELNDLHIFDFKNNRWITIFEEACSPKKLLGQDLNATSEDDSPSSGMGANSPKK